MKNILQVIASLLEDKKAKIEREKKHELKLQRTEARKKLNRPLKFRAWNVEQRCFENTNSLILNSDGALCRLSVFSGGGEYGMVSACEKDLIYVIEQYTGLKDENGKEIYEGDIIQNRHSLPDLVYFCDITASFRVKNAAFSSFGINREHSTHYTLDLKEYKIIGNIHESPELLDPVLKNVRLILNVNS